MMDKEQSAVAVLMRTHTVPSLRVMFKRMIQVMEPRRGKLIWTVSL